MLGGNSMLQSALNFVADLMLRLNLSGNASSKSSGGGILGL
jgi:hypothetical protein